MNNVKSYKYKASRLTSLNYLLRATKCKQDRNKLIKLRRVEECQMRK